MTRLVFLLIAQSVFLMFNLYSMKNLILFSVLCAAGFSFAEAQVIPSAKQLESMPQTRELRLSEPVELNKYISLAAPQLKDELQAAYKAPKGALRVGVENDFNPYAPMYVGSGSEETPWVFENLTSGADETATYSWILSGNILKGDPTSHYDLSVALPLGKWEVPTLKATMGTATSTYQYATGKDIWGNIATDKSLIVGSDEKLPLSNADYNYGGNSAIFENDNYAMGSGAVGMEGFPFLFEKDGFKVLTEDDVIQPKGIVTYYEKPLGSLLVNSISLIGYSFSRQPLSEDILLTLEIRKLDENGRVDMTGEPLATSTATSSQVVQCIENEPAFVINFVFMEESEFGIPIETDYVMDQACAVVVTGFNQKGCDFGLYCANAVGPKRSGTSWLLMDDGSLCTYVFKEEEQNPRFNAFVQLNGFYPYLHTLCEYANVPDSGGAAKYYYEGAGYSPQFISNFPATGDDAVEIVSEIPAWLTITPNDSGFDKFNTIIYTIEGTPLPTGETSRTATLVFNNHGLKKSIQINQGLAAVSTVAADQYKVVRNGNDFVLSYPADATSVSVVNALGQNVAQYDLPANGSTTVPAAVLSNGLNIFKFNGAGHIAVKAMK